MRKILVSLFLINILLSFFIFYDLENNSINERISKSGENQNYTIHIDKGIKDLERNVTIDKIQKFTRKYEGLNVKENARNKEKNDQNPMC